MKNLLLIVAAMSIGLLGCVCAFGADEPTPTLHVGDAAPALSPGKWLKGEPVTKFEDGKIYVVEFWATWCGPCRESIPHVSKLQEQYKDVTFIGQNCWEEDQSGVPAFVTDMGDKMSYRVAEDDMTVEKRGKMATAWMTAAGQNGIPTAFVIDKVGKIAWIGHPMELDNVLKGVVAGTFDAKKVAAEQEAKEALQDKLETLLKDKKFDEALPLVDDLAKVQPDMAAPLAVLKFNLLMEKKDYATASAMGPSLLETLKDRPEQLNEVAWAIVNPEAKVEKPNLDLAEKLASRAVEVTHGESSEVLDTLARVHFVRGNIDKAIELQNKAVEKANDEDREEVKKNLAEYKAAREKTGEQK